MDINIKRNLRTLRATKHCPPIPKILKLRHEAEKEIYCSYGLEKYFNILYNNNINNN